MQKLTVGQPSSHSVAESLPRVFTVPGLGHLLCKGDQYTGSSKQDCKRIEELEEVIHREGQGPPR